jgi:hypothetical protein
MHHLYEQSLVRNCCGGADEKVPASWILTCRFALSNQPSFPTKAFKIWLQTNDLEHVFVTGSFFHFSGMFEPPSSKDISANPGRSDPLFIVQGVRKAD